MVMAGKYKLVEIGLSPEKLILDKLPRALSPRSPRAPALR